MLNKRILLLLSVSWAKFGSTAVSMPDEYGSKLQPASLTNSFNQVRAVNWTNSSEIEKPAICLENS